MEHRSDTDHQTLADVLRWRARVQPDQAAYTFLTDGGEREACFTYAELDRRARLIAALLQAYGAGGERVMLVFPPGLEFVAGFYGCMYAGAVAVPVYPPHPVRLDQTLPRFLAVARDARPVAVLTTAALLPIAEGVLTAAPELATMRWLASEASSDRAEREWRDPGAGRDSLAFLQYTSGSTAAPKGVMVSHGNIMANAQMFGTALGFAPRANNVSWLPLYHDMGLIGNMLGPMYYDVHAVLMSPLEFLKKPLRWLQAVSRFKAYCSGGPNFAYDLCVRRIRPEDRAGLDLSSWKIAFNGAEPVRQATLTSFAETFAECGFQPEALYPCYGLAEATLFVSGKVPAAPHLHCHVEVSALERDRVVAATPSTPDARALVGCGQAWLGEKVVIVDPETCIACPPDRVGEVWVSGPSVAQGYFRRPEESKRTFQAHLSTGEGPFLRTGDLGFLMKGELFIAGRLKDLIIIEGRNLYPQDIELAVEQSHAAYRPGCCAAFAVEVSDKERLVVLAEVEQRWRRGRDAAATHATPGEELVKAATRAVSEQYEVRVHEIVLLEAGSIPKTSSGKIQRHACRDRYLEGNLPRWFERRATSLAEEVNPQ